MNKLFMEWLNENKEKLRQIGIQTESIKESPVSSLNQGVTIENISKNCLGQVSVWHSGLMDIEVLEIETESRLLYEHYEFSQAPDFSKVLQKYVKIMAGSLVE